ncbi:MAG: chorismate-binding protein [Planctomycetaceae bacterium]
MTHFPDFDAFRRLAEGHKLVPVYRQLVGDTLTPVSAYGKTLTGSASFLFESVVGGEKVGRYSFLGSDPFLTLSAYGSRLVLTDGDKTEERESADPLSDLEELLSRYRSPHLPGLPRFVGGAVGYAGYDTIRYAEDLPNAPADDRGLPDMQFAFYDRMVLFDHINKTILVVAHARTDADDLAAEYDHACRRVDDLCRQLQRGQTDLQLTDIALGGEPTKSWTSNFTRESFCTAVERCKEYIRAGDAFQIVLSQRLQRDTSARPLDIYRALRVVNPSPFMFLLRSPEATLVGSSPEIMVRVEERVEREELRVERGGENVKRVSSSSQPSTLNSQLEVTIRPLAGTRKRGATEEEDRKLAEELLADPKERAEHVMLIDLARNDVGRVSQFGSVTLSDAMVVERYSHVMHITSNVTGKLLPGKTALDALRAGLPAGTVSGAPKVRAMEIIDELEPHRRGPYAGAVGYIDFTGNMDTCIALRTIVMQGQTAYIQAGAGLVADSVPESEYEETLNKAKGLQKAIEVAEGQL